MRGLRKGLETRGTCSRQVGEGLAGGGLAPSTAVSRGKVVAGVVELDGGYDISCAQEHQRTRMAHPDARAATRGAHPKHGQHGKDESKGMGGASDLTHGTQSA